MYATCLHPPPASLVGSSGRFAISGGTRIVGIRVLDVAAHAMEPLRLNVFVDRTGDFSTYLLSVLHADMDPQLAAAPFGFKASCPNDFDCRTEIECPQGEPAEPLLDQDRKRVAEGKSVSVGVDTGCRKHNKSKQEI